MKDRVNRIVNVTFTEVSSLRKGEYVRMKILKYLI